MQPFLIHRGLTSFHHLCFDNFTCGQLKSSGVPLKTVQELPFVGKYGHLCHNRDRPHNCFEKVVVGWWYECGTNNEISLQAQLRVCILINSKLRYLLLMCDPGPACLAVHFLLPLLPCTFQCAGGGPAPKPSSCSVGHGRHGAVWNVLPRVVSKAYITHTPQSQQSSTSQENANCILLAGGLCYISPGFN